MYNSNRNFIKSAFTMIELSIVILVISAIVVGVSSTQLMIKKARLANAQSLTQDSIVKTLSNDLVAWYETSMESSFIKSEIKKDAGSISKWKDNNINAVKKNDATMTNTANQPKLYQNAFYNSIPGLRFDGTSFMDFDLSKIVSSNYVFFIVEKCNINLLTNFILGANQVTTNNAINLGYNNGFMRFSHYGNSNNADFSISSLKPNYPAIHTFNFNASFGKRYSINGTIIGTINQLYPLTSNNLATIGKFGSNSYYKGDLAEIIIFKRSLKTEEIKAIENYLGSKYGISVS
jgi:prepilin-type N-terminal cleavage/methylation domain-containing protein